MRRLSKKEKNTSGAKIDLDIEIYTPAMLRSSAAHLIASMADRKFTMQALEWSRQSVRQKKRDVLTSERT